MAARVGAVLVARAVGVVLARKERVQFDDGFVIGWVATHAWPDPTPPMTIEGA